MEGAPALRRLLQYLGNKAISGEAESLKEYTIGVEAFGKPAAYDPRADAYVRVQASKLREKLQAYYNGEGLDDPVMVTLPKGHFAMEFRARTEQSGLPRLRAQEAAARFWRRVSFASMATVVLAAGVGTAILMRNGGTRAPHWTADLETIWGPFLSRSRPVVLSLGTPMFIRYQDGRFRNSRLNDPSQAMASPRSIYLPEYVKQPFTPLFDYTGIGEALSAVKVSNALGRRGVEVLLQPSDVLSWEDILRHELIFIGAPKFNVHLRDLPVKQDFIFEDAVIRNLRPVAGEPPLFKDTGAADRSMVVEGYGLISRLPGLQGRGTIIILASSSTEAARALGDYVTDARYAHDLAGRLKRGRTDAPKYFQAVIWARFKSQVPVEIRYVTHHALNP